jgi:glycine/D-amino acid oxidase-like deaminating enzyme
MAFTKDRLPIIGSIPSMKNFLVSVGYSGHGLGFGFIAGKMIGEEILSNRSFEIFSPSRLFKSH